MVFKTCIGVVFLTLITQQAPENKNGVGRITATGTAQNGKNNAIVITNEDSVYFLYGVRQWDDEYYGKKVSVSGKLKLITVEKGPDSPIVARWYGTRKYIKKPKWVLSE